MSHNEKIEAFQAWKRDLEQVWHSTNEQVQMEWGKHHSIWNQKIAKPDSELKKSILERDHRMCRYCGKPMTKSREWEIDHVHPFSKGGETVAENLVVACKECNRRKKYLHGINPLPLDLIVESSKDKERALIDSQKRRENLYQQWKLLLNDTEQHNLEKWNFLYHYDRLEKSNHIFISSQVQNHPAFSELNRVYNIPEWIKNYRLRSQLNSQAKPTPRKPHVQSVESNEFSCEEQIIYGKRSLKKTKGKALYLGLNGTEITIEQLVFEHYYSDGFKGYWTENVYWWQIMTLLYWDVVYTRLSGVLNFPSMPFPSETQDIPHDMFTPEFYPRRQRIINMRHKSLRKCFKSGTGGRNVANYGV